MEIWLNEEQSKSVFINATNEVNARQRIVNIPGFSFELNLCVYNDVDLMKIVDSLK